MLEQWVSTTAWPMTPPSAYGPFHLLFLCFGLGIGAALAYGLRRCSAVRLLTKRVRTYAT